MESSDPADSSKQNTSSAVMQQRKEPHDSLDFFPTPPWATRALLEHIITPTWRDYSVLEPACGEGHMAEALTGYFGMVEAFDIHDYGYGRVDDFLMPAKPLYKPPDWTITNPPFRLAAQFIEKGLAISRSGVAMLVRSAFLEGVGRYTDLFSKRPPNIIAQFSERVPMFKGRLDATGSTATAYCWLVWEEGDEGTRFMWIPPCRKKLERPGDYSRPPQGATSPASQFPTKQD